MGLSAHSNRVVTTAAKEAEQKAKHDAVESISVLAASSSGTPTRKFTALAHEPGAW
jgi:hypothetical protein